MAVAAAVSIADVVVITLPPSVAEGVLPRVWCRRPNAGHRPATIPLAALWALARGSGGVRAERGMGLIHPATGGG